VLLGTRGVPAQYGGFETAVEEVGRRLASAGMKVTVYGRGSKLRYVHEGMDVIRLPALRVKALETLTHTLVATVHLLLTRRARARVILFNAGNAPSLWLLNLFGVPVAVHMDGLEWKRAKWQGLGARYYKWAEKYCAHHAKDLIADARGIASYLRECYGVDSHFIPYGSMAVEGSAYRVVEFALEEGKYHLVVARLEPENHVLEIVQGYTASSAKLPLVVVGSGSYGPYEDQVRNAGATDSRVKYLGSVWDQKLLDALYEGCYTYLHGHSVGGTNPSLLRAMGAGCAVTAFDVDFNREVTGEGGRFFSTPSQVVVALEEDERAPGAVQSRGRRAKEHALRTYRWDDVASAYKSLSEKLGQ
jgi:glycosyltransferase involved in cell wall biosynthesis